MNVQYAQSGEVKMSPADEAHYQTRWAMEKYHRFTKAMYDNGISFDEIDSLVDLHKEMTGVVAKKITANLKKAKVRK